MRLFEVNEFTLGEMKNSCKRNSSLYSPRIVLGIIEYFENQVKVLVEERNLLLLQINLEVEGQKPVVVPTEVANAIEFLRVSGLSDYGIIALSDQIPTLGKDYSKAILEELQVIKNFANYDTDFIEPGSDVLLSALTNGFTVETLESKIETAVLKFVEERSEENVGYIIANDSEEFSQQITEIVTKIIREDQVVQ